MARKTYIPNKVGESLFEGDLKDIASMCHCHYEKIKDPVIDESRYRQIKSGKRRGDKKSGFKNEVERPYDAVLSTKLGNFAIEAKYNGNTMEDNQIKAQVAVDDINNGFFVLRKLVYEYSDRPGAYITEYRVEKRLDNKMVKIYITDSIKDMIGWFIGTKGEVGNMIQDYVCWLEG